MLLLDLFLLSATGCASCDVPAAWCTTPDWAALERYAAENAALPRRTSDSERTVFLGDSITFGWDLGVSFPGRDVVNRGISGQTTVQLLGRFRADVLALDPTTVVIIGGVNDLIAADDPQVDVLARDQLETMVDVARTHGVRPVLISTLPVRIDDHRLGARIDALDAALATQSGAVWVDARPALADANGDLRAELTTDGVHLTSEGYRALTAAVLPGLGPVPE